LLISRDRAVSSHLNVVHPPAQHVEADDCKSDNRTTDPQAHPVSDSLARLSAAAAHSPATRILSALQRKADTRQQSHPHPRMPRRVEARDLPLPSLQPRRFPGSMATSRLAMTTAQSPAQHDPSLIPVPNANMIAVQRVRTAAQAPLPGTPTAMASQLLDSLGMTATSMSNAEYARWSETIQCKMGVHGTHQMGDRTIVTQFKPDWMKWPEWTKTVGRFFVKHKQKFNAGLVIVEAGLTIAAALVGLSAASSVGALNLMLSGIVGAVVGVAKLIRGLMMMRQAFQAQKDRSELTTVMIEAIRTTEAIGSAVALGIAAPNAIPIIAGTIFAAAKALRSFIAVYNDILAEEISALEVEDRQRHAEAIAALKTKQAKAQIAMTVVHAIESAAVLVGGAVTLTSGLSTASELGPAIDKAKVWGGSIALGVGGAKAARTALGYPYVLDDPENDRTADADPQVNREIGADLPANQERGVIDTDVAPAADPQRDADRSPISDEGLALPETTNHAAASRNPSVDGEVRALPKTTNKPAAPRELSDLVNDDELPMEKEADLAVSQ
jgi:hypothetical protein